MKKLLSILFAMLLFIALPSCEKEDDTKPSNDPTVTDDGGGVTTTDPTVTATVHFVLTHEDSWNDPNALGDYGTPYAYVSTDSSALEARVADPYLNNNEIVSIFSLIQKPNNDISPCVFTSSTTYQNTSNIRDRKLTSKIGQKIHIVIATSTYHPELGKSIKVVTHRGSIKINSYGIESISTEKGVFVSSCAKAIGIKY